MLSNPVSIDVFSPIRQHHLNIPEQCHQLGLKFSNVQESAGHCSFKSLQCPRAEKDQKKEFEG